MNDIQANHCATSIIEILQKIPNLVVVFDGPGRSQEKWETSITRLIKNDNELDKLQGLIDSLNEDKPSNISKSKWRWMDKVKKRCRIMDNDFIRR